MPNHELIPFASDDALAKTVADRWLNELTTRSNANTPYCVALPGGRIAKKFFSAVAGQAKARSVSFADVHFFWGDERCVPPADAESNFLLARIQLLDPLRIQPDRIHRVRGEIAPERAAAEAEAEICRVAPVNAAGQPVLDLIFLGMGEDGHVASLFPGAPDKVVRSESAYLPVVAPKPPPQRITINFATIAAARRVWVLASGAGKEGALRESLSPNGISPLAHVLRTGHKTIIFTDIIKPASRTFVVEK
jgi:6-phosphogluconolactonase